MTPDEAAAALRALPVPDDVAAAHLARLAAVRPARPGTVTPLRPRRRALRATVGGLVLGATLATGAGVAAADTSQPGDALYGVKTARERLQLAMARPGDSRARLELTIARTRLAEAAALLRDGDGDRAVETLARADAALASAGAHGGGDVDQEVAAELDRRVEVLGGLLDGGLPVHAADAAREAIDRALDRGARGQRPATPPPAVTPGRPGDRPRTPTRPVTPATPPTSPPDAGRPSERPTPQETRPGRSGHPTGRPADVPSRAPR